MRNHQSTTNPRISLDNTGDLVIEKVTPEDRGRYECLSTEVLPNHETGKERDRPQSNDQMLHIFYVNVINDRSIWPFNGDKKNFSTVIVNIPDHFSDKRLNYGMSSKKHNKSFTSIQIMLPGRGLSDGIKNQRRFNPDENWRASHTRLLTSIAPAIHNVSFLVIPNGSRATTNTYEGNKNEAPDLKNRQTEETPSESLNVVSVIIFPLLLVLAILIIIFFLIRIVYSLW